MLNIIRKVGTAKKKKKLINTFNEVGGLNVTII